MGYTMPSNLGLPASGFELRPVTALIAEILRPPALPACATPSGADVGVGRVEGMPVLAVGDNAPVTPPLNCHVSKVLALSSKKQVVGPDARWGVAVVADVQAIRNRPVRHLPRHTVGGGLGSRVPDPKYPVAACGSLGGPQPARVGLVDFLPEADLSGTVCGHGPNITRRKVT